MPSSRKSSQPRDGSQVSHIGGIFFTTRERKEPPGKLKNTRMGTLSLLQGNLPNPGIEPGLLYCRQILYIIKVLLKKNLIEILASWVLLGPIFFVLEESKIWSDYVFKILDLA